MTRHHVLVSTVLSQDNFETTVIFNFYRMHNDLRILPSQNERIKIQASG